MNLPSAQHQPLVGLNYSYSSKLAVIPVSSGRSSMLGLRLSTVDLVIRFL